MATVWLRLRKLGQVVAIDTLALFMFSMIILLVPVFWEVFVGKLTWTQSIQMRLLGGSFAMIPKYVFGGLAVATLSDWFESKLRGTSTFAKATATGLALWSLQVLAYLPSAWAVGISREQVLIVQGIMLAESPAAGWLYRKVLNYTRSRLAPEKVDQV
jgi:hypothetical protein